MPETDEIPRDVGKLWGAIKHLEGTIDTIKAWAEGQIQRIMLVLTGLDGNNGIKGDVKALAERVETVEDEITRLESWGKEVWNVKRPAECLGVAAVESLEARLKGQDLERAREHQLRDREIREMRKTRLAMLGAMGTALIAAAGSIAVAFIERGTR